MHLHAKITHASNIQLHMHSFVYIVYICKCMHLYACACTFVYTYFGWVCTILWSGTEATLALIDPRSPRGRRRLGARISILQWVYFYRHFLPRRHKRTHSALKCVFMCIIKTRNAFKCYLFDLEFQDILYTPLCSITYFYIMVTSMGSNMDLRLSR